MSDSKRVIVAWLTFKLDAGQLLYSVAFARRMFGEDAGYYILEDARKPLPERVKEKLLRWDCTVLSTKWNRNGNIKGGEHLRGCTQLFHALAELNGAEVLVKCDSDTAILSRSWVDALLNRDGAIFAGAFNRQNAGYAYGMAYAIKGRETLLKLAKDAVDYPAWDGAFEDYEIGQRLARLAGESSVDVKARWARRHSLRLGDWDFMLVDASRAKGAPWSVWDLKQCQAVSVGYNCTPSSLETRKSHRQAQTRLLASLWRERFGEPNMEVELVLEDIKW